MEKPSCERCQRKGNKCGGYSNANEFRHYEKPIAWSLKPASPLGAHDSFPVQEDGPYVSQTHSAILVGAGPVSENGHSIDQASCSQKLLQTEAIQYSEGETENDEIWKKHDPILRRLFFDEQKSVLEIISIMEKDYGFPSLGYVLFS